MSWLKISDLFWLQKKQKCPQASVLLAQNQPEMVRLPVKNSGLWLPPPDMKVREQTYDVDVICHVW